MGVLEFLGLWIGLIYYFAAGVVLNLGDNPRVALASLAFLIPLLVPPMVIVAVIWRLARRRAASAGLDRRTL